MQHLLRALKNKGHLDKDTYERIYPVGSQPARFYGLPKCTRLGSLMNHQSQSPFRPIVSSMGTYNYNLSEFLCDLLEPHVQPVTTTFSTRFYLYMKSTSHKPLGSLQSLLMLRVCSLLYILINALIWRSHTFIRVILV